MYDPLVDWAVGDDTVGGEVAAAAAAVATASNVATASIAAGAAATTSASSAGAARNRPWTGSNILSATKGPAIVGTVCNATEAVLGMELRQARKQLQQEVTRDTLAIHFIEIRPDWLQNRSVVLCCIRFNCSLGGGVGGVRQMTTMTVHL